MYAFAYSSRPERESWLRRDFIPLIGGFYVGFDIDRRVRSLARVTGSLSPYGIYPSD